MNAACGELSAVLLDLSMPIMDGFAVLARMHENPQLKKIPVVVTTGQIEEQSEVKALQMGASDYVSKPYNPAIIKQRIKNAIELRETAATVNELQLDRLTGLYNRNTFFEKAAAMIASKESGFYIMACFDIDSFKVINDQYGTDKGDRILCLLAELFKEGFGAAGGLCSRIMADNFAVLYPRSFVDSEGIKELYRKVAGLDNTIQPISYSIGRYLVDDLSLSVSAMYDRAVLAKESIKGRYDRHVGLFSESMRADLLAQQQIVTEMKSALEQGQFEPWFQPQYDHATGKLIGAEVLVRWRHPTRGMISPVTFVPIFERNGFIYDMDRYIWERTCENLQRWIREGRNPLPVSVNVSRYDVFRDDLIDTLTGLIRKYQVPVELLRLEITESAFSKSTTQIISAVKQLIAFGFTVEIDDFGSGYSSLNTLKNVPAQILKLDMKFLESTEASQRGGNILESIVRMAKWLDMSVIAEGVETKEQADFLKSIGCVFVQGYLYAKPMTLSQYEDLAAGSGKQREKPALETVEHLDSNAFWSPESMDTLIFNSYLSSACIVEYHNGSIELLRANDKYIRMIQSMGMTFDDALKINWMEHMNDVGKERFTAMLCSDTNLEEEYDVELVFQNLPTGIEKVYLRSTMRVIAKVGQRYLIYCNDENITPQRVAEEKRQETTEQLAFLEGMAHQLLTKANVTDCIQALLGRMLEFFNGNRCYIFEYDAERGFMNNTYELCADGVIPQKELLQEVPPEKMSFWMHAFDCHNSIYIDNVDALEQSRSEKELLQQQGIRSLVAVPLYKNEALIGFIGVDDPKQKRSQIKSLSALGDYAVVLLTRRDLDEKINRENQEKLAVMDGIPGGFVRIRMSPEGVPCPQYYSVGFQKLVKMNVAELTSLYQDNAMAGVHPDDVAIVQNAVDCMLRHGETNNVRYRLRMGGGGYIWVSIFGKMQREPSGTTFLNVYYADATEQKRQENIQKELLDHLPCGAALYETDGDKTTVIHRNLRYWELVGLPTHSDDGSAEVSRIHPEDQRLLCGEIEEAIEQKRDMSCDVRVLSGNGSYRLFHTISRISPQEDGRVIYCVTYTPVSDETQHMQELLPVILSAIMESTSDYSFIKDEKLRYLCASKAFAKIAGRLDEREIVGKTDFDLFEKQTASKFRHDDELLMSSGQSMIDSIEEIPSSDHQAHYSRTSKYPLRDPTGRLIGLYGVGRDITQEQLMTEKLRISEEEYRLVMQHTHSSVCRFTVEDQTLTLPPEVAQARGLPRRIANMPQGMLQLGVIPQESQQVYSGFYEKIMKGEPNGSIIFQCRMTDGLRWLEGHYSTVFSGDKPLFAVISYLDVTERQEKEIIFTKWQQSLLGKSQKDYTLYRCNLSRDTSTDTREGELLEVSFDISTSTFDQRTEEYARQFVVEEDRPGYSALLNADALLAGYYRGVRNKTLEYREKQPNGNERWLRLTIELVEYPNSTDVEAYLMFENIDEEKKAELQMKANAETDSLTGLLNRTTFTKKMEKVLAQRKQELFTALLMLDIDDFKQLNDCYGHIAGDHALIEVAKTLKSMLRPNDLVGRLGGDEFLVCLCDLPDDGVIERRVDWFREQMKESLQTVTPLTASVGISVSPKDGNDFNTLYQKADVALYHAKRSGKNHHSFYQESMESLNT